jgi:hypothetical protein
LAGASTSADITFGDNDKAIFGAGSDLQIYHTGAYSSIRDAGTGALYIGGDDEVSILNGSLTEYKLKADTNGAVTLYYDNSPKLATTATGVDITGTLTSDGLTVGATTPILRLDSPATAWAGGEDLGGIDWYTEDTSGNGPAVMARIYSESSGANTLPIPNMIFQTSLADVALKDRMQIAGNGDISFYEDTGTTAKFFWDASEETLNIGASANVNPKSFDSAFSVNGTTNSGIYLYDNNAGRYGYLKYDGNNFFVTAQNAAGTLNLQTADTTRLHIDSSGNVGIGTISPSNLLHVEGAFSTTTQGVVANFDSGNDGVGSGPIVKWSNDFVEAAVTMENTAAGASALTFETMSSSSLSEAMRITSSGELVNTGSTLPSASVQGFGVQDQTIHTSATSTSARNHHIFYNGNGAVGSIKTSGSSTSYNTSSDYRLKENVVELTGATDRLKQLEPKRFNFIADADTTVDGFIAHEVQSIVPEAITGTHNEVDADGNPVYQGIDQSKLVPLLVATIQELEARITALENA